MHAPIASDTTAADVILVGGGLASSLIALRLKRSRPALKIIMLEREMRIGGEHTWCHFASDVSPEIAEWLAPLIVHDWPGYEVRFPAHRRALATHYRAITSPRLHAVVSDLLKDDAWLGVEVAEVTPDALRLADGRRIAAPLVIDARGPRRSRQLVLGWQKFLGQEVRLAEPHGLICPIVMDATVAQLDGYRFVYVLPLSPDRLLIEDTRYSDGPGLDHGQLSRDIGAYAAAQGWSIRETLREEDGVLPIALAGDIDAYWDESPSAVAEAGLRAALFHPTTGYSLPDAARQAETVARLAHLTTAAARDALTDQSKTAWRARGYYRLLNRMLFRAAEPDQRYRVLQRFYRLAHPLIERFYASEATLADKIRTLSGWPPVPFGRALTCIPEAPLMERREE